MDSFTNTPIVSAGRRVSEQRVKCFQAETLSCLHASEGKRTVQSHEKLEGNCLFRQHQMLAWESQAQMSFPAI